MPCDDAGALRDDDRGFTVLTAARAGLLPCELCGLLNRALVSSPCCCARCGTRLHRRKPNSESRTWAFLIAASVLYVPANMLPVFDTSAIGGTVSDTIMSGALRLWMTGAWPLAVVILVASIGVPLAKLLSLSYLLIVVRRGATTPPHRRARVYRVTDFIGRWSMVDIYVGTLLVGLVHFQPLAVISPGPGAMAFGAVVVLTMLASHSFDPRLLWDRAEVRHG
jgi:paraquat-inducible protein A